MIQKLILVVLLLTCCACLPVQQPQQIVALLVGPETLKNVDRAEVVRTAGSGWRNPAYLGGWVGQGTQASGWRHTTGAYRGGLINYPNGWNRAGYYTAG